MRKDYKKILELSKVIVFRREGYNGGVSHNNIIYLDTPLYNISSTLVRERLKKNEKVDDLLPQKVADFIQKNKLYR